MLFGRLSFIFEVMVYVGIGLPLLNLLLGAVTTALGGGTSSGGAEVDAGGLELDIDAGGLDVGGLDAGGLDIGGLEAGGLELDAGGFDACGLELDAGNIELELGGAEVDLDTGVGTDGPSSVGRWRSPVGFNLYCLCLSLVIMGALGVYAMESPAVLMKPVVLVAALALSILAYCLMYRFIVLPLQRNKAEALSKKDLLYKHALVTFRILRDSPGKIQAKDAVGAYISYIAQIDTEVCGLERIDEGEEVIITEVDEENDICMVTKSATKGLM